MTLSIRLPAFTAVVLASVLAVHAADAQPGTLASQRPVRSLYSWRDAIGWSVESLIEEMQELPTEQVELGASIATRAQALAAARTVAAQRSTPALRAYLDTTTRDPQELRQIAAYAAMNGGDGAMAFLLAAEKRRPGDWATQYNIAVFLMLEGYPRASKVLLDSLQAPADARAPGDIDLRATLLLARGNALIAMGRPQQAIPLLKEAREREPLLSEAARSLALAHLLAKQEEEAKRALRLGGRRFASTTDMEAVDDMPPVIDAGDEDVDVVLLRDAFQKRDGPHLTLNDRWPLHKGQGQSLTILPPPASPEEVAPFLAQLEQRLQELEAQSAAAQAEMQTAALAYGSEMRKWELSALRSQLYSDAVLPWGIMPATFSSPCTTYGPWEGDEYSKATADRLADEEFASERLEDEELASQARRLRRSASAMCSRLSFKLWQQFADDLAARIDRCPDGPQYRPCMCRAQRTVASMQVSAINAVEQPYLSAVRSWYSTAHHHATGVAGYIEPDDKVMRTMVKAGTEFNKTMVVEGVHQYLKLQYQSVTPLCAPEEPPRDSAPVVGELGSWDSDPCSSVDGMAYKVDMVVFAVKLKCYEVEWEGKAPLPIPGFSAIGSVAYTFGGKNDGNVTIFMGTGVGLPGALGVDVSAKAGTFVTFNDGYLKDGGFKLSTTAAVGGVGKSFTKTVSAKEVALDAAGSATYISNSFVAVVSPPGR